VRGGRQPDDDDARRRIAEARNTTTPVAVVAEGCPLLVRHPFAPLDQARAHATRRYLGREAREIAGIPGDHGGGSYAAALMRVLLLVNATASSVTARSRVLVRKALAAHHDVEVAQTTRRGHATKLARAAANDGFDVVVVLAGDGTLNEAADGLVGTACALAALPGGSTNVYAQTLHTPPDAVRAAEAIARALDDGSIQRIGVGNASGRRFLFHCGIGFDAAVIRRVERYGELKRRASHPLFVTAAFATWFRHFDRHTPGFDLEIVGNGERIERVFFAIVSKTTPYTFLGHRPIHVAPEAGLDRPLALTAFTVIDPLTLIGGAASAMLSGRWLRERPGVVHRHDVEALRVVARATHPDGVAWQVDGDDLGDTAALDIAHEAECLSLVIP